MEDKDYSDEATSGRNGSGENRKRFYSSSSAPLCVQQENVAFIGFNPQVSSWPQFLNDRRPLQSSNHQFDYNLGNENFCRRSRRRLRTIFSNRQVEILEKAYNENKYPDACVKKEISKEANLQIERVQVWFQNKRTRDKRLREDKKDNKSKCDFTCRENQSEIPSSTDRESSTKYSQEPSTTLQKALFDINDVSSQYAVIVEEQSRKTEQKKVNDELAESTPVQESPSNTMERSCQQYLQSLGQLNTSGISPSFIRYLQQQLRMSPSDCLGIESLSFERQQRNCKLTRNLFQ